MMLYKKAFPLKQDMSFSDYINRLRKEYFPNFVLTIDKIPSTESYRAQIFFIAPLWKWGVANAFHEGVLLKECTIQESKDERCFTLQASAKATNLFLASFYVIFAILLFIFAFVMMAIKNTMSFSNIFILAIAIVIMISPSTLIYIRDKKLLDKVGSLGTESPKN